MEIPKLIVSRGNGKAIVNTFMLLSLLKEHGYITEEQFNKIIKETLEDWTNE